MPLEGSIKEPGPLTGLVPALVKNQGHYKACTGLSSKVRFLLKALKGLSSKVRFLPR